MPDPAETSGGALQKWQGFLAWAWAPQTRFIPIFLGFLWLLTKLANSIPKSTKQSLLDVTTWIDFQLLDLFTEKVAMRGTTLTYDGFAVQVITECTGLYEAVILAAAILAYQASWRQRLLGIVGGTAILYAINIVRIAFLLLVGRFAPAFFDFAHVYFWQSLLIVFITAIWIGWIHYCVRDETDSTIHA